jgi:hypothetical protein
MKAGPGRTIMASPINITLNPIVPMRNRRIAGRPSSPRRMIHFWSQRFTALFCDEFHQFLFEMRRDVRGNQRVFPFVSHLEDMADAVKFRDEI